MVSLTVQESSCCQTDRQTDTHAHTRTDTTEKNTTLAVLVVTSMRQMMILLLLLLLIRQNENVRVEKRTHYIGIK